MTRRLRIVHRTGFRYEKAIPASYNEARMTLASTPTQAVLRSRVEVSPVTWTNTYQDYWGTQVTSFDVVVPHRELTVVATSTVEVTDAAPLPADDAGWDVLNSEPVTDRYVEYLTQTDATAPPDEVVGLARDAAGNLPPSAAARAVLERLRGDLQYVRGATAVTSDAAEVWRKRQGVCQDFAHLGLGALRSLGIPARYVSGYVHPQPEAEVGETVAAESHAWLDWWAGDWVGFDPTSVGEVRRDHVVVGRGRGYADVTPLKGVYAGPSESSLFVAVEITRQT